MRSTRPAPRGRPRSLEAHGAILAAAITLIREVGYDALAMDAIAARAGVGKATVYRRWKTKEALVAEALEGIMRRIALPDTGTTRGDLRAMLSADLRLYRDPPSINLLSGLVASMARSPHIARVLREGFVAARREALRTVLQRGIRRGDLRKGMDLELAMDLANGPFFYRSLLSGMPTDEKLIRRLVDALMRAFGT